MASLINVILTISTLLTAALCIPNVTVVPAEGGCSAYPGYDASIGTAGPWTIILNSCDNSTIERFGDSCQVIRRAGDTGIHEGRVSLHQIPP